MPWIEMRFRGETTVLARCDGEGRPVVKGGRVEIRYRLGDAKTYRAASSNLAALAGAKRFDDDESSPAQPVPGAPSAGGTRSGAAHAAALSEGAVVAYADGACSGNPGPAGLGVVLIDGHDRHELSEYLGHGTNNIAELTAVLRVLEQVDTARAVHIHTDSSYAIGVLSKGWKAKANVELIGEIRAALRHRSVRLVYVPGHAGVVLNERADSLARAAVEARRSAGWRQIAAKVSAASE